MQYSRAVNNEVEGTAIPIKIFGQITAPHCARFVIIISREETIMLLCSRKCGGALEKGKQISPRQQRSSHSHTRLFPCREHNGKAYVNSSLQEEHFSLSLHLRPLRLPFAAFFRADQPPSRFVLAGPTFILVILEKYLLFPSRVSLLFTARCSLVIFVSNEMHSQ